MKNDDDEIRKEILKWKIIAGIIIFVGVSAIYDCVSDSFKDDDMVRMYYYDWPHNIPND